MTRLLVVEDRDSLRRMLVRALSDEGYEVESEPDAPPAVARLAAGERFDLVLSDLKLPGGSGIDVLRAARLTKPAPEVVVLTGFGTVPLAVEAMKLGAADFLEKPVDLNTLLDLARSLVGEQPAAEAFVAPGAPPIVGRHSSLRAALRMLQRVAPTETTVLLTGDSGTGKELFARALHALSPRSRGPFVAVNCAAIPETLVESELFGHEKGAFTGADRRRPGRFELARGGTLFLDEIGELSLAVQAKVLRVLDDHCFERVGGSATLRADVRVVAATNRELQELVDSGGFRPDLLFRLEIFPIRLPTLAERASDLPLLTAHLLDQLAARHGAVAPRLDDSAMALLARQEWPGNVRQLANVLERALILHPGERLRAADLEAVLTPPDEEDAARRVRQALEAAEGDKQKAAEALGISYRTLLRKVRRYGLEGVPRYRS